MKNRKIIYKYIALASLSIVFIACKNLAIVSKTENKKVPESFINSQDSTNSAKILWKDFFKDSYLTTLIDEALKKNQEYNIILQEINIAKNEVRARKGAYLPSLNVGVGAGVEKVGLYTSQGANDANTEIAPNKAFPDPLGNLVLGVNASWEIDVWKKLRNSKKSAVYHYLSTIDGKNFMVTNLVSEIANSYYELLALDNQLEILKQNIQIQQNALEIVKLEKAAAKVTELAVRKFEAEVYKNQSRQYSIMQQITVIENKINFLVGRFPQPVARDAKQFNEMLPTSVKSGIPSQLLENRADVKQAEQLLAASKLDIKAAKAEFYPSLRITLGTGFQAFNLAYLIKSPQSLLYSLAGDLVAPLINRNAIKANFYTANSKQIQAAYNYERTILNAYIEVTNQLSNIDNLDKSYNLKTQQVEALNQSIEISTGLFKAARADYMEVLLTQRDAIEAKFDLVETKMMQMNAMISIYRALGGGWR